MMRLKATSRLGKAQVERTGSTLVGNRNQEPRSSNDRASDADQVGVAVGDPVVILTGRRKGSLAKVMRIEASKFGGGMRAEVALGGNETLWLAVDDLMDAIKARRRFQREPSR